MSGDSRVLKVFEKEFETKSYAIEKSLPLIQTYERDILVVGRDF
ncbi:hypothetical protein [Campylobacter sp. MIT 97-5078]|nr:hypothetical protein [Campylobacter sp. MIT 97-5078]